jgi:hypothetical protein
VQGTDPGDVVVAASDGIISIEKTIPEATNVFLPPSSQRQVPLVIKDTNGVASGFPITIVPNGAETIDGDANLVLSVDKGAWQLSLTTDGWLIA